jgi:hypothetical protein
MVYGWSAHEKLAYSYCMKNNKAFTLTNSDKTFSFAITDNSYQRITSSERTKRTSLLAKLKGMFHRHFFKVKNCITWCQNMVTLCLVFNPVSRSFLILV